MTFFRQLFCWHRASEYVRLVQTPGGFKVMSRCCRCGKVEVGKGVIRG
jgi:hypothetical protein